MIATTLERWRRSADRIALALVIACVVTVSFVAFVASPGHLSIDEITYHVMARELWTSGRFDLLTGYQDVPSAAYVWPVTVVHDGRLVPQYPALHSVIALPFYAFAGYRGLFLLNAGAFCATVWLVCAIARRIACDRLVALAAGLIYAFATFAWDYAAAAWPHALATLFVTGAVYLALRALQAAASRDAVWWGFAAGLVAGFGVGVRIDVVFVTAALIVPLLFARPVRLMAAVAVGLGVLPGLAVIAWINHLRFGIASPFTYGRPTSGGSIDPMTYLPVLAIGLAAAAIFWLATRPRGQAFARRHRWPIAAAVIIGCAVVVPVLWTLFARFADGLFQLVVDMRIRDLAIAEGGLTRGPGGGMIYLGKLKTSLLQSCPYLVALAIPVCAVASGRRNALPLAMLLLVPAAFIGAYGYFAWHGGLSLDLRYFTPILPATSVLTVIALRILRRRAAGGRAVVRRGAVAAMIALAAVTAAFVLASDETGVREEFIILTLPLIIAGAGLAAIILSFAANPARRVIAARSALALSVIGLGWAAMVAFAYHAPTNWALRAYGVAVAKAAAPAIAPKALLLVDALEPFAPLFDRRDISIVEPRRDDFATFRRLVEHHLQAGRPVYAVLTTKTWALLEERGLMRELQTTRVGADPSVRILRIDRRSGAAPAGAGAAREMSGKPPQSAAAHGP